MHIQLLALWHGYGWQLEHAAVTLAWSPGYFDTKEECRKSARTFIEETGLAEVPIRGD
jgi:hypothetical protein